MRALASVHNHTSGRPQAWIQALKKVQCWHMLQPVATQPIEFFVTALLCWSDCDEQGICQLLLAVLLSGWFSYYFTLQLTLRLRMTFLPNLATGQHLATPYPDIMNPEVSSLLKLWLYWSMQQTRESDYQRVCWYTSEAWCFENRRSK